VKIQFYLKVYIHFFFLLSNGYTCKLYCA
jgi:hypothetical protein